MTFEICYFNCSRGQLASGPRFEDVEAADRGEAIEKFFAGKPGRDVHWKYVEPKADECEAQ